MRQPSGKADIYRFCAKAEIEKKEGNPVSVSTSSEPCSLGGQSRGGEIDRYLCLTGFATFACATK